MVGSEDTAICKRICSCSAHSVNRPTSVTHGNRSYSGGNLY